SAAPATAPSEPRPERTPPAPSVRAYGSRAASTGAVARETAPATTNARTASPCRASAPSDPASATSAIARAVAPNAPMRGSRMISSARGRSAPSASAVSARASRWRPPVRTAAAPTPTAPATRPGSGPSRPAAPSPATSPTPAPTTGNRTSPRATSSALTWIRRPSGTRVRNVTAARAARPLAVTTADPSGLKCRHLVEDRERRLDERQRQRSAAPLAEAEPEVQQRLELEGVEDEAVAGLGREVRGDHRGACPRRQPLRDERRHTGDEAVEEDDDGARGGADRDAGEERDLEAAEPGERSQRVVVLVRVERPAHDRDLAREPGIVDSGPPAHHCRRVGAEEPRGERRCRRRVADPHLAERDEA